jgi:hypothetical protein
MGEGERRGARKTAGDKGRWRRGGETEGRGGAWARTTRVRR